MRSEVSDILKRSRKPVELWKTVMAVLYGVALLAVILGVITDELWTELRVPLIISADMNDVTWARVDLEAEEPRQVEEDTGVIVVNSEAELAKLAPSKEAILVTWAGTVFFVCVGGAALGMLLVRLGYFKDGTRIATLFFFTVFGLTMMVPFMWMISMALKSLQETRLNELDWIPWPVRWSNFHEALYLGAEENAPKVEGFWLYLKEMMLGQNFIRFYINSMFISSYVTMGMIFTSALAAYSFARLEFPGRDKLFLAYLATMMIPGAVISIPVFVLMCKIGWVDNYRAIIIPAMFSAYGTFMLRQFFMTLPKDLEDAAKIDGCSLFGIFLRIIIPLSKPALATLVIFTFMGQWRNFMWPLIILNDPKKMPLPVGLQFFAASSSPDPNVLMAATMMMIIPVIIVFIMGQRYFVEGIQLGAIKG